MAKGSSGRNFWILFLLIIAGIVIGGFLGELFGHYAPILKFGYNLGVSPHTWDLKILKLTFGIMFNINIFSILGIILAVITFRRL